MFEWFLLLVIVLSVGGLLYMIIYGLWTFLICPAFGINLKKEQGTSSNPLQDPEVEVLLEGKFSYYRSLAHELKPHFVSRVKSFLDSQEFVGKDLEVTEEMKILISASAIQVTFGLTKYTFDNFNKIIVFPREYKSPLDHRYHLGEVNLGGVIVIS